MEAADFWDSWATLRDTLQSKKNALLLTNIRELEERDRVIRHKNEQMETDLRMATELQQALMPNTYPSFPLQPERRGDGAAFFIIVICQPV